MSKKSFGHIEIPLKRVHIELTNICDFNCIFCPKTEMERPYGQMDTDLAKRIIKEIGSNGISEKITFHVMGEPTLHRDFFEILEYAQKEKVNVGLTTNGGGLGGETGKRLLDYPLHQVDVSLQTPDKNSFAMRKAGSLSFEDYLGGILDFFHSYNAKNKETIFKFRFFNTRFQNKELEHKAGQIRVMSSTKELRETFSYWTERIYDVLNVEKEMKEGALKRINSLVSYKWNVVEVFPKVFFETYLLSNWANAFNDKKIRDAWAGYCFGMRDHFSILHNGDVTLCCIDYDGKTAIGNLHKNSLAEVLSSERLGRIINGFKKFKLVHPYCKFCLGSRTFTSWLFKPFLTILSLKVLKPFFYVKSKLF